MNKKINLLTMLTMLMITSISMLAGTIPKLYLNGNKLFVKETPIIKNGSTYIPARVMENLGANVAWDAATQTVTINNATKTKIIEQRLNSNTTRVNSQIVSIAAPAIKHNGAIYIPLEFVSETLGATIITDAKENSTNIKYELPKDGGQKYDSFGRLLRTTNLPKNQKEFTEFAVGVPNKMYEVPL